MNIIDPNIVIIWIKSIKIVKSRWFLQIWCIRNRNFFVCCRKLFWQKVLVVHKKNKIIFKIAYCSRTLKTYLCYIYEIVLWFYSFFALNHCWSNSNVLGNFELEMLYVKTILGYFQNKWSKQSATIKAPYMTLMHT